MEAQQSALYVEKSPSYCGIQLIGSRDARFPFSASSRALDQHEPILTVTIEGLTYAQVYDLTHIPRPAWYFHDSPGGTEPRSPPRRLPGLPQLCGSVGSSDYPPKRSR
jgi:hypothetical protein